MSDFISDFWSNYVAIITVTSILLCAPMLLVVAKDQLDHHQLHQMASDGVLAFLR